MPRINRRISIVQDVFELVSEDGTVLRPIIQEHAIRRLKPEDYQKAYERSKANWVQLEGQLAQEIKQAELQGIDWEAKMLEQLEAAEAQQIQQAPAPILGIPAVPSEEQEDSDFECDGTTEQPFGVEELEMVQEPLVIETPQIRKRGRPRKEAALVN